MMASPTQHILDLTARDLMAHPVLSLPQEMPVREAAGLLLRNQCSGAPVVDKQGRCVGILSATAFMRIASQRQDASPASPAHPVNRPLASSSTGTDSSEITRPALAPELRQIQVEESHLAEKEEVAVPSQSSSFCTDWQAVEMEKLPAEEVRRYMTADPVTVPPEASIRNLARMIRNSHMHRVIVVDGEHRPMGIVTAGDIMDALADAEDYPGFGREERPGRDPGRPLT